MREQLLRQALESGKTTSKKNRAKQDAKASSGLSSRASSAANSATGSPNASRGASRAGSRQGSRHGSDEENSDASSDDSAGSTNSTDGVLSGAADNLAMNQSWEAALAERVENILNRNKRRQDQRESDLKWYLGLTQNHFAESEISFRLSQLTKQFLRAAASDADREAILALKCLSITVFTAQTEPFYDTCSSALRSVVEVSASDDVKAEALHALSTVVFVSGDLEYTSNTLTYLLEIIESDGNTVDAHDSASVVAAAAEAYMLLLSIIDDPETLEELSQDAIEELAAQLKARAASVQVAATQAIALLYEKSWREPTRTDPEFAEIDDSDDSRPPLVQMYNPYRQTKRLIQDMTALSHTAYKGSRSDRRAVKEAFDDAMRSMEHPRSGPRWSEQGWKDSSNDPRVGKRYHGETKMKVRVNDSKGPDGLLAVDRWWKFARVRELRRCTGQGFMTHYAANEVFRECLLEP